MLSLAAAFVVPAGVALSFAAGQERHTVAVAGEHTAVAAAGSQHYTAAAVAVLDRILLERTC